MVDIFRDYQVIDGFVQEPPNLPKDKNTLSTTNGIAKFDRSSLISIGHGAPGKKSQILRVPPPLPPTPVTPEEPQPPEPIIPFNGAIFAAFPLNGDFNDVSGNNRHLIAVNDPQFISGDFGQAVSLVTANETYLKLPITREEAESFIDGFAIYMRLRKLTSDTTDIFSFQLKYTDGEFIDYEAPTSYRIGSAINGLSESDLLGQTGSANEPILIYPSDEWFDIWYFGYDLGSILTQNEEQGRFNLKIGRFVNGFGYSAFDYANLELYDFSLLFGLRRESSLSGSLTGDIQEICIFAGSNVYAHKRFIDTSPSLVEILTHTDDPDISEAVSLESEITWPFQDTTGEDIQGNFKLTPVGDLTIVDRSLSSNIYPPTFDFVAFDNASPGYFYRNNVSDLLNMLSSDFLLHISGDFDTGTIFTILNTENDTAIFSLFYSDGILYLTVKLEGDIEKTFSPSTGGGGLSFSIGRFLGVWFFYFNNSVKGFRNGLNTHNPIDDENLIDSTNTQLLIGKSTDSNPQYFSGHIKGIALYTDVRRINSIFMSATIIETVNKIDQGIIFPENIFPQANAIKLPDIHGAVGYNFNSAVTDSFRSLTLTATNSPTYTTGIHDNCIVFNGTNQRCTRTNNQLFNFEDGSFFVSMYIYPTSVTSSRMITGVWRDTDPQRCWAIFLETGQLRVRFSTDGTAATVSNFTSGTTLSINTWYHVIIGREDDNIFLILNGAETSLGTFANTHNWSTSPSFSIGSTSNGANFYAGQVDEYALVRGRISDLGKAWFVNDGDGRSVAEMAALEL